MKTLQLRLDQVRTDSGCQYRVTHDPDHLAEIEDAYRKQEPVPNPTAFWDGEHYWLADGFHRRAAAIAAESRALWFDIHDGDRRAAVLWSFGPGNPNSQPRGLKLTHADKRNKVDRMLADPEWGGWSDTKIARACCVSDTFVASRRKIPLLSNVGQCDSGPQNPASRKVIRSGKTYNYTVPAADERKEINQAFDRIDAYQKNCIVELKEIGGKRTLRACERVQRAINHAVEVCNLALEASAKDRARLTSA